MNSFVTSSPERALVNIGSIRKQMRKEISDDAQDGPQRWAVPVMKRIIDEVEDHIRMTGMVPQAFSFRTANIAEYISQGEYVHALEATKALQRAEERILGYGDSGRYRG